MLGAAPKLNGLDAAVVVAGAVAEDPKLKLWEAVVVGAAVAAAPKLKPEDAVVVAVLPKVGVGAGAAVAVVLPRAPNEGGGAAAVLLPNVKDEVVVAAVLAGGFCVGVFPKENTEVAAVVVIGVALDVAAAEPPN